MKKVLKVIIEVIMFIMFIFCVGMIALLMSTNKFGYTQISNKTLIPIDEINITELDIHNEGDLIIIDNVLYNKINQGDILYYYDTLNEEYIIKYGTVKEKEGDNRSSMYIFEEETAKKITSERIIGKLYKVTKLGKLYKIMTSSLGFLCFVILPILMIFVYQVYKFVLLIKEK